MNKIVILACLLALSGCTVDGYQFRSAYAFCEHKGGVDYLIAAGDLVSVRCYDGTYLSEVGN